MYTLDTNAIIYYLKNEPQAVFVLNEILAQDVPVYISTITELELFSFRYMSIFEMTQIENLLQTLAIIPVDSRIARTSGILRQMYRIKTADSAIAATALFTNTTLLTRNVQDFYKIADLEVQEI